MMLSLYWRLTELVKEELELSDVCMESEGRLNESSS